MPMSMRNLVWMLIATAALSPAARAQVPQQDATAQDAAAQLQQIADDFFAGYYFREFPSVATASGVHDHDRQLEDYSRAGIQRRIATLTALQTRLASVQPAQLNLWQQGDRDLLLGAVQGALLDLQVIRPLQRQPDRYSSGLTEAVFVLAQRDFAPAVERLRAVIAREWQMPAVLQQARVNLVDPPRIHTEVALEQLPGIIGFFQSDLPAAFAAVTDPVVRSEFAASNAAVIRALQDYQGWLRRDLLPRSHGDFRLGAATFRRKLQYEEMVDVPLPRLLRIGMADLRRNQREFARVAHELDPHGSVRQVLAELTADHPARDQLLDEFRATLTGLKQFIVDRRIIDLPEAPLPTIEETPPFMRATTFASMDTPGPFETRATEAYFNVTLPDVQATAAETEDFMKQFSRPVIRSTAIHEAFPGHYVQFLWMHRIDDRVRKLLGANSNAEGWAHYCEQMVLDEGYTAVGVGASDRRASLLLRLGQLQDALLRDARFVVGLRMHTGTMSFDQGEAFFVREGYQTRTTGRMETTRGTSDPTYLYYTLGKLQILRLRADLQARQGAAFSLQQFHDDFMRQGFPPLKIVRRALLGDDSPTL